MLQHAPLAGYRARCVPPRSSLTRFGGGGFDRGIANDIAPSFLR
jgi:hypothetical protein